MERGKFNYWVDVLLVVCFVVMAVTGLLLYFVFVSGQPGTGKSITFLGEQKHFWLSWHSYFGLTMLGLMTLHLILHFKVLVAMTKNMFSKV